MTKATQLVKATLAVIFAAITAVSAPAAPRAGGKSAVRSTHRSSASRSRYRGVPTFADSFSADVTTFDDPIVREAAVEALGRYNGAVVAVEPNTGRILTVVNQKIAFGDGYIPCSTIKPAIAIAALEENVITRDTMLKVGRRKYMNLTEAMAGACPVTVREFRSRRFSSLRSPRLLPMAEHSTICNTRVRKKKRNPSLRA